MAFNKIRSSLNATRDAYNTSRDMYERYDQLRQNPRVRAMGGQAMRAAGVGYNTVRRDGTGNMARAGWDAARGVASNPEVQRHAVKIGREMGSAAIRGAILETGVRDKDGKFSIKGAIKAVFGLKTGVTQKNALVGAAKGGRAELRNQGNNWNNLRNAASDAWQYQPGNTIATSQSSGFNNPFGGAPSSSNFGPPPSYMNTTPSSFGPPPSFNAPSYHPGGMPSGFNAPPASYPPAGSNPFGPPPSGRY